MYIQIRPQGRDECKIWYEIEYQKITATIDGVTDIFDFREMPNGKLQLYDDEGNSLIETTLIESPIMGAYKENDVLYVDIVFSINADEKTQEVLFPKLMSLDEFYIFLEDMTHRKEAKKQAELDRIEQFKADEQALIEKERLHHEQEIAKEEERKLRELEEEETRKAVEGDKPDGEDGLEGR